jgi:hypothetical protein
MAVDGPIALVYGAAVVAASSLVITRPTQSALLPALSRTPDELTAANGAAGIVEGVGIMIGPLVAAAVMTGWSIAVVFAVAGACLVGAVLATAGLRPDPAGVDTDESWDVPGAQGAAERGTDRSLLAGLRTVVADGDARLVVGLLTVRMVIIGAADVLFVLMALDLLAMGEPGAGVLNAALGAGTVVGGALTFVVVGRRGLTPIAAAGALAWGLSLGAVGLLAVAVAAPPLIIIGGAGLAIVDIAGRTILQRTIRDDVLARVFGIQEALAMGGLAVGSILVAAVVEASGLAGAIAVAAILLPATVVLGWRNLSALDRRAVVPVRALQLLRRTRIFAPLPGPQLEAVARRATWLTHPSATEVIRQGDPGDRFYVLASGAVRITQDGRHLRDLDRPGDGFGEIALLRDVPRTATVTTTSEVALLAIDRSSFLAAVTGHPDAIAAAGDVVTGHVGPEWRR